VYDNYIEQKYGRVVKVLTKQQYEDLLDKQNKEIIENIELKRKLEVAYKKIKELQNENI